ncbi:Hsp20/alpha crystallin family protein [Flavobacteriaceae bacterium XHP0103]|uniref:Hsp20/alpha crystallin family protein n=1 Tax=Marixanthotalea marina TaxID=2844359 RepID=UPI002989C05B|nr:Hsp20/alpha crystallin family protein [Marixanthotalea marina]MBU3822448.1 Hsp20/alpha crystallin family protein [Marixanthotalea marina]
MNSETKFKKKLVDHSRYGGSRYFDKIHDLDLSEKTNKSPVKITETDKSYHFELEKHGYIKEDFNFYISKDILVVTSEKRKKNPNKASSHSYCYPSAYFKRRFNLPENVVRDKILVDYEDGILSFDLLKSKK